MIREDESPLVLLAEPLSHLTRQMQLLFQPDRNRRAKRPKPGRCKCQVRFQQPLKGPQRLIVKPDIVELIRSQPGLFQTVVNGVLRKSSVVLLPSKPLFLSSSHDLTIHHQSGRRVVIKCRDSKNCGHVDRRGQKTKVEGKQTPRQTRYKFPAQQPQPDVFLIRSSAAIRSVCGFSWDGIPVRPVFSTADTDLATVRRRLSD